MKITGSSGEETVCTLSKLRVVAGSRTGVDIHHPDLSAVHAEFRYETGEWVVERLDPNAPISFMGSPVYLKKLNHGDCLHLGSVKLTLFRIVPDREQTGPSVRSSLPVTHYLLECIEGAPAGLIRILHPGEYILGRGSGAGRIDIPDQYVSKQHTRLTLSDRQVQIEDLGSANGTIIDNQRVWYTEQICPCTFLVGQTIVQIRAVCDPDSIENPDLGPTAIWE